MRLLPTACAQRLSLTCLPAQSAVAGSCPGAVESWDGARLLVRELEGVTTPDGLAVALAGVRSFEGLGGRYELKPDGELSNPQAHVYRSRVEAGRWVSAVDVGVRESVGSTGP